MTQSTEDPISAKPWNSAFYGVPAKIKAVPTMLTDEEGRMLRWLAEFDYQGKGAICELGSFVGGSTARLAFGLSKNTKATGTIHSFDRFECAEKMKDNLLYKYGIPRFDGTDILPISKKLLAEFVGMIEFHKGELLNMTWPADPIELLFVDIAKSVESADFVAKTFYPNLIPGRSLLVHQDYFFPRNPWVLIQMELFADKFDLVGYAENNSAVFRSRTAVSADEVAKRSWTSLTNDDRVNLALRAIRRFPFTRQREHIARLAMTIAEAPSVTKASQYNLRQPTYQNINSWVKRALSLTIAGQG